MREARRDRRGEAGVELRRRLVRPVPERRGGRVVEGDPLVVPALLLGAAAAVARGQVGRRVHAVGAARGREHALGLH